MTRATPSRSSGRKILAPRHRADHPRIEQRRLRRARDPVLEIGGDLEQLGEFLVLGAQQVIERGRPDQHDLEVERDRLGLQRHRARHAEQLLRRLDADLAGVERPLQRGPAEIAGQQLLRVEHEVAAIGAVQRAGDQQVEIGDQRAEPRQVLDPADQRLMRRVVLVDDRRAVPAAIVDDDVDLIAAEPAHPRSRGLTGPGTGGPRSGAGGGRRQEIVDDFP